MRLKRIKILRILLYVFIAVGLGLIFWPVYTNFIASRSISEELSEWEELKSGTTGEETITETENTAQAGEESSPETEEEISQQSEESIEDVPVMDFSFDGTSITTESGLTAEDFFPMKITIPKIELEYVVLEGTDSATLKKGAGHESVTPLPGEEGRCTISGHRTTYGAPFNRVDELEEGDLIYLETLDNKTFVYSVTALEIVNRPMYGY